MKLTAEKAKELSLEVWTYFRDNSSVSNKHLLPAKILRKILRLYNHCPLCEYFGGDIKLDREPDCSECPLISCGDLSLYGTWYWTQAEDCEERQKSASEIVRHIESWNIEGLP